MKMLLKIALAITLTMGLMAGSCQVREPGKPAVTVNLPKPSAYYLACFNKLTPIPTSDLTREKVILLVAELRKSEKAKSQCGKDLLDWYERIRIATAKV